MLTPRWLHLVREHPQEPVLAPQPHIPCTCRREADRCVCEAHCLDDHGTWQGHTWPAPNPKGGLRRIYLRAVTVWVAGTFPATIKSAHDPGPVRYDAPPAPRENQ